MKEREYVVMSCVGIGDDYDEGGGWETEKKFGLSCALIGAPVVRWWVGIARCSLWKTSKHSIYDDDDNNVY